jgi:uncharacterized lipoprotein YddW (UPF0748 family)
VRPACDALDESKIEPGSEYLTGTMGQAPAPFYDPLAFAVAEAHKRGLELHAWFNPFRVRYSPAKSPVAANHVSKTNPQLVKKYGKFLWLDPGEPDVQNYSLNVVMDVVRRYDVDGAHFDDYFYPYKDGPSGTAADFPDDASWRRFGARGNLSRDDWRRENVNMFIQRVYKSIKAAKPWVKFGVSPFGIWRPGNPPQIRGKDAYSEVYADSRKWLNNGWLDYLAPQLYWADGDKEHSFSALLKWWAGQNTKARHLWPGIAAFKGGQWKQDEIPNQIRLARKQPGVSGCILYSARNLMTHAALAGTLKGELNAEPALVPASPWLDSVAPEKPGMFVSGADNPANLRVTWNATGSEPVWLWIVQIKTGAEWTTEILPGSASSHSLNGARPDAIAVTAVDRTGNASPPAVLQKKTDTTGKASGRIGAPSKS